MAWLGVDLDGTLAEYQKGYAQQGKIGEPIDEIVYRVKQLLDAGHEVRIMTARVSGPARERRPAKELINAWCRQHLGRVLPVTCRKDYGMLELWDDRARQVVTNRGVFVHEDANDLRAKLRHLFNTHPELTPEGHYTFPDGETWTREVPRGD